MMDKNITNRQDNDWRVSPDTLFIFPSEPMEGPPAVHTDYGDRRCVTVKTTSGGGVADAHNATGYFTNRGI